MNRLEEFMGKNVISENVELSEMIEDILPIKQNRFTDLEIEANKKQEFRVVVYKKENVFVRFFKNIKFSLEKLKIIKHSKSFEKNRQEN